jgi:hypothetical protein
MKITPIGRRKAANVTGVKKKTQAIHRVKSFIE